MITFCFFAVELVFAANGEWGHQYLGAHNFAAKGDGIQRSEELTNPDGPCVGVEKCQNGGYCFMNATVQQHCVCPPGYSGL